MMLRWILILAIAFLGMGYSHGESVSFVPELLSLASPQNFSISIHLDGNTPIRGFGFWINHDPDKISFVSAIRGSLFNGMPVGWWRVFTDVPGLTRVECIIFGASYSTSGPGTLLNLNYTALSNDISSIQISQLRLFDPDSNVIAGVNADAMDILVGMNYAYGATRCFLQGAYLGSAMMHTGLHDYIPLVSPYQADPAVVDSIPANVVDWVLAELKSQPEGPVAASRSMFLLSDGKIVLPGTNTMIFPGINAQAYHIGMKHRNHLSILSSDQVVLVNTGTCPFYDLASLTNIYNHIGVVELSSELCALKTGDANQDGVIGSLDRDSAWRIYAGASGYLSPDFDLDGNVFPNDLNDLWRVNQDAAPQNVETQSRGALSFSFANARISEEGGYQYLNTDILLNASDIDNLGTGMVLLDYNPEAYGYGIFDAGTLIVSGAALLGGITSPNYNIYIRDNHSTRLAVTYEFFSTPGTGTPLGINALPLLTLKLKIINPIAALDLQFQDAYMADQQYLDDNSTLFTPVEANGIIQGFIPTKPFGVTLTRIQPGIMQLSWTQIPGCTYSVYSSLGAGNGQWEMEANGLINNSWTCYDSDGSKFYRVTANNGSTYVRRRTDD